MATVICDTDCVVRHMTKQWLDDLAVNDAQMALDVHRMIARRLAEETRGGQPNHPLAGIVSGNQMDADQSAERPSPSGDGSAPKLPPRWFIRAAWVTHRAIHRVTGGWLGLAAPKPGDKFGMMRLTTTGRRTGLERAVILSYIQDGPNFVTLAMNGWADPEPAWWLNLQAHPDAVVELKQGSSAVRGRIARGEERERLWAMIDSHNNSGRALDSYAKLRSGETAVVVLEPRSERRAAAD